MTDLLITLTGTPTAERAARTADPKKSATRMCAKVRAATVRSYVRAWRPLWRWWTGTGNNSLPLNPEAVLTYLEQRASEPCVPSVLRRTRAALDFYEEAAGLPLHTRVSKCIWFGKQFDALELTLCGNKKGTGLANPFRHTLLQLSHWWLTSSQKQCYAVTRFGAALKAGLP